MTKSIKTQDCSPWDNTTNIASACERAVWFCSPWNSNCLTERNGRFLWTVLGSYHFREKTGLEETKPTDCDPKSAHFVFTCLFCFNGFLL